MNLASILALVLSNPQKIQDTVGGLVSMLKATTASATVEIPAVPATKSTPAVSAIVKKPSETVRSMQKLLNQFVKPEPPLKEDGWLGDQTEKAIEAGIAMARPYIAMLG